MVVQPKSRRGLLEAMRAMLAPARVERGCLSCRFYEDVENRNAFILLEEWATQEDLERHLSQDSQRHLLALMEHLSEQPELRFNTISGIAGMALMEKVRKEEGPR